MSHSITNASSLFFVPDSYNSVEGSPPLPSPPVVILIPVSRPTLAIKMKPEVFDIDRLPVTAPGGSEEQSTSIMKHSSFYLPDGNIMITAGNTRFRAHLTILSQQSPVLRHLIDHSQERM